MDAEVRMTVGCEILIEKNVILTAVLGNEMCRAWLKIIGIVAIHALPAAMRNGLWSGKWCGPDKPKTLYFLILTVWRFGLNHVHLTK